MLQGLQGLIHLGDLGRDAAAQPVAHGQPGVQVALPLLQVGVLAGLVAQCFQRAPRLAR